MDDSGWTSWHHGSLSVPCSWSIYCRWQIIWDCWSVFPIGWASGPVESSLLVDHARAVGHPERQQSWIGPSSTETFTRTSLPQISLQVSIALLYLSWIAIWWARRRASEAWPTPRRLRQAHGPERTKRKFVNKENRMRSRQNFKTCLVYPVELSGVMGLRFDIGSCRWWFIWQVRRQ